jgi:hypothetical protein
MSLIRQQVAIELRSLLFLLLLEALCSTCVGFGIAMLACARLP